jgi:hypothetical protein
MDWLRRLAIASGPGWMMDNTSRLLVNIALASSEPAVFQNAGSSKESENNRSPTPGRVSAVDVAGCAAVAVAVAVAGNQMTVAVGVALAAAVGVRVGVAAGPLHPASIDPHTATSSKHFLPHFCLLKWGRCRRQWGPILIVSFIVSIPEEFSPKLLYNEYGAWKTAGLVVHSTAFFPLLCTWCPLC